EPLEPGRRLLRQTPPAGVQLGQPRAEIPDPPRQRALEVRRRDDRRDTALLHDTERSPRLFHGLRPVVHAGNDVAVEIRDRHGPTLPPELSYRSDRMRLSNRSHPTTDAAPQYRHRPRDRPAAAP